jgi:hypothetical protein
MAKEQKKEAWNKGLKIGLKCWVNRARPQRLTRSCPQCGGEFTTLQCQDQKYCSTSCRSKYTKARIRNPNVGRKLTREHRIKLSQSHIGNQIGDRHPRWKGGRATERKRLMAQYEYVMWRSLVFERDDYTCQKCGARGCFIMAHHIKSWSEHKELRYDLGNGITLCKKCHAEEDVMFARFYKPNLYV